MDEIIDIKNSIGNLNEENKIDIIRYMELLKERDELSGEKT